MKKICLHRALLHSGRAGQETFVIVNCHMPTKWQSPKEYKYIEEEIRAAWYDLTQDNRNITPIFTVDLNTEFWAEDVD